MKLIQVRVSRIGIPMIVMGLLVGLASTALAEGHGHKPCSNATLEGSYGYYRSGPILDDGGQLAAVGLFTYDGKGGTVGSETVNRNGVVSVEGGTGFYQVNSDCTGALLNEDHEEYSFLVVMDGGATVYLVSDNNPIFVVATRISDK